MKKEYAICRACPIKRRCHTELTPTVLNAESNGTVPVNRYEELQPWECLSFTCTGDGATAARQAAAAGWRSMWMSSRVVASAVTRLFRDSPEPSSKRT